MAPDGLKPPVQQALTLAGCGPFPAQSGGSEGGASGVLWCWQRWGLLLPATAWGVAAGAFAELKSN